MSDYTRPLGLNHVAYLTRDTARTVDFYTNVLGLRLVGHAIDDKVSVGSSSKPPPVPRYTKTAPPS